MSLRDRGSIKHQAEGVTRLGRTGIVKRMAQRFRRDGTGNVSLIFGLAAIPLFLAAGIAVDTARHGFHQQRLNTSVDAAALAVAKMEDGATNQEMKDLAYNTLTEVRYIKRIHNELTIEPNTGFSKRSNDTWITTRIKSKMLFSSVVDPSAVKVVTEEGVVYLMGLVDQATADAAVDMARNTNGVQKVVRIFEYIDNR